MKKQSKIKIGIIAIILLASIVSVSGCIGDQTTTNQQSSVSGLIIKNLYTDPQQDLIQLGNQIKVSYDIENVGGARAENVLTTIYGVSWMKDSERQTKLCYPENQCDPKLTQQSIAPPDPISKISETKHISFAIPTEIKRPEIPVGKSYKYPLTIRTSYIYDSSAITTLTGYSRKRYERDIQIGRQKMIVSETAADVQQTISGTPISIAVTGPDRLIIPTPTQSTTSKSFTYHIAFTNIGQGYPISQDEQTTGVVYGTIRIEGPGATFEDCLGFKTASTSDGGKTIKLSDDYKNVNVLILRGSSILKSCTIKIDATASGWNQRDTDVIHIYFDLKYRYYIEKSFDITISSPIES